MAPVRSGVEAVDKKIEHVNELNKYLKEELSKIDNVHINSNDTCIPHIVNISVKGIKPETMLHALETHDIYISTKTACAEDDDYSLAVYEITKNMDYAKTSCCPLNTPSKLVYALTKDKSLASTSIRISLSHLTTKEELSTFIKVLTEEINNLTL